MAYPDQKFYSRHSIIASPVTSWGTATASGVLGNVKSATVLGLVLPKFFRRVKVAAARLRCTVIPDAASTAFITQILNGTNTAGVVTLTTATAGQILDAVMSTTAAYTTFTADQQATMAVTGTSTASGAVMGSWEVWFELQELPLTDSTI